PAVPVGVDQMLLQRRVLGEDDVAAARDRVHVHGAAEGRDGGGNGAAEQVLRGAGLAHAVVRRRCGWTLDRVFVMRREDRRGRLSYSRTGVLACLFYRALIFSTRMD